MRRKIALSALALFSSCCVAINQETQLYGTYELKLSTSTIVLRLMPDHTYSESAITGALHQQNVSRWKWQDNQVCFDSLLISKGQFKGFEGSASLFHPKEVGQMYQLDYCSTPMKQFGKTILEIDPDSGHNFVRK